MLCIEEIPENLRSSRKHKEERLKREIEEQKEDLLRRIILKDYKVCLNNFEQYYAKLLEIVESERVDVARLQYLQAFERKYE